MNPSSERLLLHLGRDRRRAIDPQDSDETLPVLLEERLAHPPDRLAGE